ncbi:glycosyltransferase [Nitratiruptor tergarcus]|uniref:Glycosyltransferase involved in cell wall bisynthesis n=1 Tax=Nitratiruptor tergarcus DSM 16512 TaxID=1069081 RepID=A0A1W1WUV9_9BACT|nr:glycosyltransferase [Nitratiruptor tergarcus]SMC09969.1 Glycosyltransferase involved in cell wall bisynthesis [Nitratiruptor tergarcus DSM 16512]
MKTILFITPLFYPQNQVAVLRIGDWSKYLAKNSYKVIILTSKKYSFMGPFGLEKKLPKNIEIIEVDFLPVFLKKRFNKEMNKSINNNIENSRFNNIKLFVRKIRNYIGSLFDIYDFWINPALEVAIKIIKKEEVDFIITSYSPPAGIAIAHKLKKIYPSLKWIADFRDLWAYNHIIYAKGIFRIYEKYKEKKLLSNVDKIITVSDPLTNEMKKHYPCKAIFTIENGYDPEEFKNWKNNITFQPKINNKLVISYLGTIYPKKRDPSILFEVINELIEEKIIDKSQIEINFFGDNKNQLEDMIKLKNYNKFGIINIKGFVSREESLRIQKDSDILLFLEWNNPSAKGVLTGKLFEYLVSGRPILGVGITNKNEAGKVIEKTRTGKLFINKNLLKRDLKNIFLNKKIDFYNPDVNEIERYSRDKQILKLIEIIES